jgi:DNA-binding IclR family transcriptional regulator
MTYEISILRALLCLTTHRVPATIGSLHARVGGTKHDVNRAIVTLANADMVTRTLTGPRLSLAGFAVAVACAPARAGVVNAHSA